MALHHDIKRRERVVNSVFLFCFLLILVGPIVKINYAPDQVSEIDNRVLAELPPLKIGAAFTKGTERYLLDRIGFRAEMIQTYQNICDLLFKKLVHPIYMYGEEGHIFFKGGYIDDYQHVNINKILIEKYGSYLDLISHYLAERNIKFLYFLAPDKKSVYSEFFPRSINVFGDSSQATLIIDELKLRKIPLIHPIEEFFEAKKYEQIYNKKFDAGHWNEHGAFLGYSMINQKLNEYFPSVELLFKSDFTIRTRKVTYLPVSKFKIDEVIPYYTAKPRKTKNAVQNQSAIQTKILVFHDSYFNNMRKYYSGNSFELKMINIENFLKFEEIVEHYQPDLVLIENAERSLINWYSYLKKVTEGWDSKHLEQPSPAAQSSKKNN